MAELDSKFAGSIPALYDRYLGPLIFEPYATDLAERLADLKEGTLLETAAGTGVVTRTLARMMSKTVSIVATDLNQPMLDFAAGQFTAPQLTWRQANALSLPFPDGTFDVVVCQFGVMFFPDKSAAYREARRVLKAGGRFIFSSWDRLEENEVPNAVAEGIAGVFPDNPPRFMARTPHGYCDKDQIQSEVRQAGFRSVEVETVQRRSRAASHRDPAVGFCQGSPMRNEDRGARREPSCRGHRSCGSGSEGKIWRRANRWKNPGACSHSFKVSRDRPENSAWLRQGEKFSCAATPEQR